jgi:hypothetical protein
MLSLLLLAALGTASLQVEAETLSVANDGRWSAQGSVRLLHDGDEYHSDRADYRPVLGTLTLTGSVRSVSKGLWLECQVLSVGKGRVEAGQASATLRAPNGEVLAVLRAGSLLREDEEAHFNEVEFSLCTCPDRPWSIGARKVHISAAAERVNFSVPVFRILDIPVLALPWWSMPLKRRASGVLPPVIYYDARDGLRVRTPIFWAPSRWWDLSLEPGWIETRGLWSLAELRMRPNASVNLHASLETLHGLGLVDDQKILALRFSMLKPGIEWLHSGLLPSDGTVVSALSADASARTWRVFDAHHRLRLGSDSLALRFQSWSGRLANGGQGAQNDASLSLAALGQRYFPWGSASTELGLAPMSMWGSTVAVPMFDTIVHGGGRWAPYLGLSTALGLRSLFIPNGSYPTLLSRTAARIELYTLLDNGRGTRLRPRLSLRAQRLDGQSDTAPATIMGVNGEVLALGFEARQAGFVHDYELLALRRLDGDSELRAALLSWTGTWKRKFWSLYGHLLMDSLDQEPVVLSTSFSWKPKPGGRQGSIGYLRRHIGRDLTIDPDPWLSFNQQPYAESLDGEGVYSLVWGTAKWRNARWDLATTAALRPVSWSLNSIRLEAGYTSSCRCWGLTTYGGYSGVIRPGEVSATPFFGLSFNSGRSSDGLRRQMAGALGRTAGQS